MSSAGFEAGWVRLDVEAVGTADVVRAISAMAAGVDGVGAKAIEAALMERVAQGHIAVGEGIAIPHAMVPGLRTVHAGFVRVREPIPVSDAPDGRPVDLWFAVLGPPGDDTHHLVAVANIARLARAEAALDVLRSSKDPVAVARIIASPEAAPEPENAAPSSRPIASQRELVLIEIEGEQAIDRLLLDLAGHDFEDALVIDGLSLSEVASRELPLFASFRDLFGDPGGRRLIHVTTTHDRAELLIRLVRRACREARAQSGRISVIPMRETWRWEPEPAADGGH
jgi:PTS system nitrogen regulatory IIA component